MESTVPQTIESLPSTGGCPLRCLVGSNASGERSAWLITTLALTIADQWLKTWAVQWLVDPIVVIPKVLQWHLTWNTGVAFGLLKAWPFAAVWASSILTFGLLVYSWRVLSRQSPLGFNPHWAFLALLSAGAISNGYDRWARGAVVDFIDVMAIQYPIFNGADVLVCLGVAGLLYQLVVTKPVASLESLKPL